MQLNDSNFIKDQKTGIYMPHSSACQDTNIKIYRDGELSYEGRNKVIVSGAGFTAHKHFPLATSEITPSYNASLSLEQTVATDTTKPQYVYLFAVGTDGCGTEASQVYPVDYKKRINPTALVPFRYPLTSADISASLRTTYFGRKTIGDRIAYYFKAFDTAPVFKQQFDDGTDIDANIFSDSTAREVVSYVELKLKVSKDDCREYFVATTGINNAKINSISLLTAWANTGTDGYTYYQDIRPLTCLHFSNQSLIDLTAGLDIVYQVYY